MIARLWRGTVPTAMANAYEEYINRTGVDDYRRTEGNRGVYVLRQEDVGRTHFLLISFWDSWDAIRAFAGEDVERARYYPEDSEFLLELDPKVEHYDVAES